MFSTLFAGFHNQSPLLNNIKIFFNYIIRVMLHGTMSQRRFLAHHNVAMVEQCCNPSKQCRNNVATLCCAKNRRFDIVPCNITFIKKKMKSCNAKGDVTRDDSQRRFLAPHSVASLLPHCFEWLQHCSNIATLCCAKNRRFESSLVRSPL